MALRADLSAQKYLDGSGKTTAFSKTEFSQSFRVSCFFNILLQPVTFFFLCFALLSSAAMQFKLPLLPLVTIVTAASLATSKYSDELAAATVLSYILPAAITIWALYHGWFYPTYLSPLRHIPTVPGFPLWGHFFTIVTTEVGVVQREWHTKYGGIVRYYFPFGAERLSIADDDAIKQMTVRNPYNFPKPVRAKLWMMPILGEGMIAPRPV